MRVLGLDIGERRVGVAASDPGRRVATPLMVLPATDLVVAVTGLVEEYGADTVVVGLPLSMDGSEGPQALRVREAADELARELKVPVAFWDERLSSEQARRALRDAGRKTGRRRNGQVDMVAATLILQSFLDAGGTVEQE